MGSILSSYSSFPAPRPPASDGHILATGEFSPPVPASPASGSSFYRISSTCTFDLPLDGPDATTADYFFRARGSTSEGDVVIEMIEAEDGEKAASGIRVVIEARYQDPDELEAVTLCLLAKVEGGPARGVGLYTPTKLHIPRNPIYFHTRIQVPRGASFSRHLPTSVSLTTTTTNTAYTLSLADSHPLASLAITTTNGGILSSSSSLQFSRSLRLKTTNAPIGLTGERLVCPTVELQTTNGSVTSSSPSSTWSISTALKAQTSNKTIDLSGAIDLSPGATLKLVTSNASVSVAEARLLAPAVPAAAVKASIETSNGPISIVYDHRQAAVVHASAKTSNAAVKVVHRAFGAGTFHGRTSGPQGVQVEGEGVRDRQESGGGVQGSVGISSAEGNGGSTTKVESSNAGVKLRFE